MPSKITFVDPFIRVRNVRRSTQWYQNILGLKVGTSMPEGRRRPTFVRMNSGDRRGVALMISDGSDPMTNRKTPKAIRDAIAARRAQRVVSFYYRVNRDVDGLYRAARRKGARVVSPPQDMPYGMREFTLRDPDGYEVAVGQEIRRAAPARRRQARRTIARRTVRRPARTARVTTRARAASRARARSRTRATAMRRRAAPRTRATGRSRGRTAARTRTRRAAATRSRRR